MAHTKRKRSISSSSSISTNDAHESTEGTDTRQPGEDSEAAIINRNIIRIFEAALQADIEVDLKNLIPGDYQERLAKAKADTIAHSKPSVNQETVIREHKDKDFDSKATDDEAASMDTPEWYGRFHATDYIDDYRPELTPDLPLTVLFPFSEQVQILLSKQKQKLRYSDDRNSPAEIADTIIEMLWDSDMLYCRVGIMVLQCSKELVAKVKDCDTTEYTSCEYLTRNAPDIPVPRMHGCIRLGNRLIMFMSYIPSASLDKVWPKLSHDNKKSICDRLNQILERLRTLRQPDGLLIGGVAGEAAWEVRCDKQTRKCSKVISTSLQFHKYSTALDDWDLAKSPYMELLHSIVPPPEPGSVFTHGDLQPGNIRVDKDENSDYFITGIIDWEFSGFYPEHQESVSMTRYLRLGSDDDWCLYLPEVVAPHRDRIRFLFDQLMDRWILGW
jgi:Phosphotransferase enzyme family